MHHKNESLPLIRQGWPGNTAHNGVFMNRVYTRSGMKNLLKWRFTPNPYRKEKSRENWNPDFVEVTHVDETIDNLIWLGHSSFYLCLGGKKMLFDPVFGDIPFRKRHSPDVAEPSVFKDIDYILISHDHFDHLDKDSMKKLLHYSPKAKVLCGLGVDKLINKWVNRKVSIPMGWYQRYTDGNFEVTFLPAQHWSKRSVNDGGKRLWGSFAVKGGERLIYYSGDTGYDKHFKEAGHIFGYFDYALMAVGAYMPRFMMERNHISPYEAVDAVKELRAEVAIPMHYGTFDLSDEPMGNPPEVFAEEAEKEGLSIRIPKLGEKVLL